MARRRLFGYPVRGESRPYCPRHAKPSLLIQIVRRTSLALAVVSASQVRGRYPAPRHQLTPSLAAPEWPRLTIIRWESYSSGRAA